jgi:hypothetical protein
MTAAYASSGVDTGAADRAVGVLKTVDATSVATKAGVAARGA